ncbi:hypothetical protein PROFUN_02863 [Planoprotostelium fungivorum]|uniref:Ribosomal protein L46 N-terminal domain-containing protein n=1 Tax=Planoprotostelium fungivorum TaxID=1890364 RepID=A0A2P6NRX4_9EUKA|nr:hypothetical protein PROFUN_02863 [Planoprotostelium fungivorum]
MMHRLAQTVSPLRSTNNVCKRLTLSSRQNLSASYAPSNTFSRGYADAKKPAEKKEEPKKEKREKKEEEDTKEVFKGPNVLKALRVKTKFVDQSKLPLDTSGLDYNIRVAMLIKRIPLVSITPQWKLDYDDMKLISQKTEAAALMKQWEQDGRDRLEMELKFRAQKTGKKNKKQMANTPVLKKRIVDDGTTSILSEKIWPLITSNDEKGILNTTYRQLTENLYMLIKKTEGSPWQFPEVGWVSQDLSNLKKTADRVSLETLGDDVNVHVLGNAPIQYRDVSTRSGGEKPKDRIFYYTAVYMYGKPDIVKDKCHEYIWVTRDEIKNYLAPEEFELLDKLLIPQ